jgi:hypothetical protein
VDARFTVKTTKRDPGATATVGGVNTLARYFSSASFCRLPAEGLNLAFGRIDVELSCERAGDARA